MFAPKKDGASIDNAASYSDALDVHYTSGVMNKAFCRAAKRLSGVDPDERNGDAGRREEGGEGMVRRERQLLDVVGDVHAGLPGRHRRRQVARLRGR